MRLTSTLLYTVIAAATLAACADEADTVLSAGDDDGGGKADGSPWVFRRCTGHTFSAPTAAGFRHFGSKVTALTGARHRAQDVVAQPTGRGELVAKFAYGPTWKDLEDENATFYLDTCGGWSTVATVRTDDDGEAHLPVTVNLAPGVYEVRAVARGDASQTTMNLWVLPAGTHVAVTDIDGTLTTADTELFMQLFDGSYVPKAYPSAAALTQAEATRGHVVVYLTGRPAWLLPQTRAWLAQQGFAPGPIHTADSNADILPTDGSVGAYKTDYLDELEAGGLRLDLGYGNATTDIHGYKNAGLAPAAQWIIGTNAGAEGTHAVRDSWATRTAEVLAGPQVTQPF